MPATTFNEKATFKDEVLKGEFLKKDALSINL